VIYLVKCVIYLVKGASDEGDWIALCREDNKEGSKAIVTGFFSRIVSGASALRKKVEM